MRDPFLSLPAELITNIICWLPSFPDVFAFAATCRRHRQIWSENVTVIYNRIAPKTIRCRRDARLLLADQGGADVGSPVLSASDVLRLVRNQHIVEKAIDQFNRDVMCHVHSVIGGKSYYPPSGLHPPCLTPTERPRFIGSYYQLWGLMRLDPASRRQRLDSMTLKQLYRVYEMALLQQTIGDETIPAAAQQERERGDLAGEIWNHIQCTYQRIHKREASFVGIYGLEEGFSVHYILFDHAQELVKEVVCGKLAGAPKPNPVPEESVWTPPSDDEG
ncbi:hypothetical protein VTN77DRAFT_3487 [Rasamsonia byssochlamydoides]|uniref:uncharacterized protein n=1 Tax=Rasamsonia byssochlamydoides TaxID=89139 RepID=UPI0037435B81